MWFQIVIGDMPNYIQGSNIKKKRFRANAKILLKTMQKIIKVARMILIRKRENFNNATISKKSYRIMYEWGHHQTLIKNTVQYVKGK